MDQKNNFILFHDLDYCISCKTKSLCLISDTNRMIDINEYDDKLKYSHIHCKNCGKDYAIDWSLHEPRTLTEPYELNYFLQKWKH